MRYMEYIYLMIAVGLCVFLVSGFQDFSLSQKLMVFFAIALTAFMFSFRRKQRLIMERREAEEIEQIKKELDEEEKQDA